MCGIFGIHRSDGRLDEELLEAAGRAVAHRGPDSHGTFLSPDRTVGLAHRRLAVIDLSEGASQPMKSGDGRHVIVYNGEVYDFAAIRDVLEAEGERFRTRSDTEVVLAAYRHWGPRCLEHLSGMFAFAVYDEPAGRLFLARDRVGKKPLFYARTAAGFLFASELASILETGLLSVKVDPDAMNFYLALGFVPGGMCLLRGVRKLPPAHALTYELGSGRMSMERYWDIPEPGEPHSEGEALEELEALLAQSVRMRLVSDVPLGAFLSGGVDSSLVTALMRRAHGGAVRTFSVGFAGSPRSELLQASRVARHLGTEHTAIVVTPRVLDDLEHVSGLLDEPVFDNSLLPTYYLSRETRAHVTVALSGDGGDELFGGYIHYQSALAARRLGRLAPGPLRAVLRLAASHMPEGAFGRNTLRGAALGSGGEAYAGPLEVFSAGEREHLLPRETANSVQLEAPLRWRTGLMGAGDFLTGMCRADFKSLLPDDILVKVDRASMMNSLEARCPLLDHRIAEFSFRHVPAGLCIRGGVKKYLLKRLAARLLPPDLVIQRKQGFDIPADLLARSGFTGRLRDLARENTLLETGDLMRLIDRQERGRERLWHKLFAVYFLLRWVETWAR